MKRDGIIACVAALSASPTLAQQGGMMQRGMMGDTAFLVFTQPGETSGYAEIKCSYEGQADGQIFADQTLCSS